MRFLNPKNKLAFKKIFGSNESKDVLTSFLNMIVYSGDSAVEDLEIVNPCQDAQLQNMNESKLSVKATTADNKIVTIETHPRKVASLKMRALYNATQSFSLQVHEDHKSYSLFYPVVLTIVDFEMFPNRSEIISRYSMMETTEQTCYPDDMDLVFVELPKFSKSLDELTTITDRWLYFLQRASNLEAMPGDWKDTPALQQAFDLADTSRLSKENLHTYQLHKG